MKKIAVGLAALIALLFTAGYFCLKVHESESVETSDFVIESPYLLVIKGLASKNSLEKIVEENDGVVKNKNWDSFQVEVPRRILRIREYKLEGTMKFTVEKKDPDLGHLELPFVQEMHLDDQILSINTRLVSPQEHIASCQRTIEVSPSVEQGGLAERTHVSIKSELKVRKTIPFFFGKMMDERVARSNKKDLEQLKSNIMNTTGHKPQLTIIRQGRTM